MLMPLDPVPTLLLTTEKERQDMEVFDHSLHWESLDCDLSVEGLMAGQKKCPDSREKPWRNSLHDNMDRLPPSKTEPSIFCAPYPKKLLFLKKLTQRKFDFRKERQPKQEIYRYISMN